MSKSTRAVRLWGESAVQSTTPQEISTMKYLCLIYEDETFWTRTPKPELDAILADYRAFGAKYKQSGHMLGGHALEPTATATTIRVRNGKMSTTDGPFAETREQLGGYYMLEAKDLNEAIQIAAKIPGAKTGSIEVRPIMVFPDAVPSELTASAVSG
jgi:hypothetical protein